MNERAAKLLLSVGILVGLGGGIYLVSGSQTIDLEELQRSREAGEQNLQSVNVETFSMSITESDRVIIDTRTPDEYAVGHLEGARNIDFYANDFDEQLSSLDRETPYAIYCRSGNRSAQTLRKMQSLGFKDVVELEGGIVAWEEDGKGLCTKC